MGCCQRWSGVIIFIMWLKVHLTARTLPPWTDALAKMKGSCLGQKKQSNYLQIPLNSNARLRDIISCRLDLQQNVSLWRSYVQVWGWPYHWAEWAAAPSDRGQGDVKRREFYVPNSLPCSSMLDSTVPRSHGWHRNNVQLPARLTCIGGIRESDKKWGERLSWLMETVVIITVQTIIMGVKVLNLKQNAKHVSCYLAYLYIYSPVLFIPRW